MNERKNLDPVGSLMKRGRHVPALQNQKKNNFVSHRRSAECKCESKNKTGSQLSKARLSCSLCPGCSRHSPSRRPDRESSVGREDKRSDVEESTLKHESRCKPEPDIDLSLPTLWFQHGEAPERGAKMSQKSSGNGGNGTGISAIKKQVTRTTAIKPFILITAQLKAKAKLIIPL